MLYLIGLGLNKEGLTYEAMNSIKNSRKVYLENYTVEFPYDLEEIQELVGKKIVSVDREYVESDKLVTEASKGNVALLIYGNPLMATTHISLIQQAKEKKIPYKVIHAGSILDAVAETGLQIYKFGKITSLPTWQKSFTPTSFIENVKENQKIKAHSLILVDIGLKFQDAIKQIEIASEKEKLKLEKIIVCERLGLQNQKIHYNNYKKIKDAKTPFCIIIPGELHFIEKEFLESFNK